MEEHTATIVLRRVAPAWAWLRANFKLPAVVTISLLIAGWVADRFSLSARVTVLEEHYHTIERVVTDSTSVAALNQRVNDFDARLTRVETNWDDARNAAALPPTVQPPRRSR